MQKSFFVYAISIIAFTSATATEICPIVNVNEFKQAIGVATMDESNIRRMFVLNDKRGYMEPADWAMLAQPNASKRARSTVEEVAFIKTEVLGNRVRCYYSATMSSPFTATDRVYDPESPNPTHELPEHKSSNIQKVNFKMTYLLPSKDKQSKAS